MKPNFIKENIFILLVIGSIVFFIACGFLVRAEADARGKITTLEEQIKKIATVKESVEEFYNEKPYLEEEAFRRKVPPDVMVPLAAARQASIVMREAGIHPKKPVVTLEQKEFDDESGSSSAKAKGGDLDDFTVGSKKIRTLSFEYEFQASYESFMEILEKLRLTVPLIVVNKFELARTSASLPLDIKLTLDSYTELIAKTANAPSFEPTSRGRRRR